MDVRHNQNSGECTIEEVTGLDAYGQNQWGNTRTSAYRIEYNVVRKRMWDREERDTFTKMSVYIALDPQLKYRVWLNGADTGNPDRASEVNIVRPVYAMSGAFVHTVLEL